MKIWELHSQGFERPILTTPDGEANIEGLVVSERAYLLAVRDYRPAELVALVVREGAPEAAARLMSHYGSEESLRATGGRGLMLCRGHGPWPTVRRSDEQDDAIVAADRTLTRR